MRAVSRNQIAGGSAERDAKGIKSHSPRGPGFPRERSPPGSSTRPAAIRASESGADRAAERHGFLVPMDSELPTRRFPPVASHR